MENLFNKNKETNSSLRKEDLIEKILSPEISCFLTEIREASLPFYKKAKAFENYLLQSGCQKVVRFDCDVCVGEYLTPGQKYTDIVQKVLGEKNFDALLDDEKQKVIEKVDKILPEECKTRVQAETSSGYLTFCFDCDSTMCANVVKYPDNPNWDKEHLSITEDFLLKHPELGIEYFTLSGSTRRYVCIDALVNDAEKEGEFQEINLPSDKKIKIFYSTRELINLFGEKDADRILKSYRKVHRKE